MRFRIYRAGSLEVRTTEAHDGEEAVVAAFSVISTAQAALQAAEGTVADGERIVKVTEYVETTATGACHTYVVLETVAGGAVAAELLDGNNVFRENPADLDDRNSLAKVLRSAACASCTVGDVRGLDDAAAYERAARK
mmetsp:Transcript_68879/g.202212  ORF Transcript_68879/g.202212 Transcript_68879/m.202212 type:complete len:138 (-) Transcript_68879:42-455(-)